MWIVDIALRRPYTFIVMALLLPLFAALALLRMPVDIFPSIPIPILAAVYNYTGLAPDEIAGRIVTQYERSVSTLVNDVEHIESQSLPGVGVVKVFLHPGAAVERAQSQMTASAQSQLRQMPPGISPPLIIGYDAANVPILQIAATSSRLAEHELNDLANNFLRVRLATVQGASLPNAYGGKQRQILVDLDPAAMAARGITASDVTDALGAQNLMLPGGSQKIGPFEYDVRLNGSTDTPEALNDLPVRVTPEGTVFLRDVAHVRDGFVPQTNIVRVNGQRAVLTTVQRGAGASTLDIIGRVKAMIPQVAATLPEDLEIRLFGDQSVFVKAAVSGVIFEGLIAACLTGLLILFFLGSWRSTFIIFISIPLSIMAAVIALAAFGQTINIMTLSGFALAVGILVDDATVTIENINSHLEMGKPIDQAIRDGAQQIVLPALVSVLCICVVFLPMFFLSGVAGFLFVPLAQAVVFAMLASFLLSRTLVPTLARYWLAEQPAVHHAAPGERGLRARIDSGFIAFRERYTRLLGAALRRPRLFPAAFLGAILLSLPLVATLGTDFFPAVDAGQIKLHVRARSGLRVEETAALCDRIGEVIRAVIPPAEIESLIDNIGIPNSGVNLTYSNSAPIGVTDADISISLTRDHGDTADYVAQLRDRLPSAFPGVEFSFLPADIVSQILNLGLPAPIDVQVIGNNVEASRDVARRLMAEFRRIPGLVDLRIQQTFDRPILQVDVDRTRAGDAGLTQREIAQDLLISLSGSSQTSPTFWLNPRSGVQYSVSTQTPQYRMTTLDTLRSLPLGRDRGDATLTLGQFADIRYATTQSVVSHYNVQPVLDLYGNVAGRDLGGVVGDLRAAIARVSADLPRGVRIETRGQMETMRSSFTGLYAGLALAILLVYLLLVVTFQSWTDALIIIAALPAAIAGILWCLFLTWTTLSVPALTGAILCMGVATANSILVVSFARERLAAGDDPLRAVLAAGHARFRPVLMTALAMIVGMLPMALGLGEGGEQNAPLGRAVIGGLVFATVATLFFVPAVFALLRGRSPAAAAR